MPPQRVGRYLVFDEIASGGMASVHLGRLVGPAGFGRIVAIKRLHAHLQKDPDFVTMLLDEARIASRIYHPNVVQVLDVVTEGGVLLILEYVHGESLWKLVRTMRDRGEHLDADVAVAIVVGVLRGLHAAHETTSADLEPLGIVHRDVSPHNILVDSEGTPRLLDFGIAKAAGRITTTRDGQIKGKLAYMAPEQLKNHPIDRRVDVYAAGVVLWELLTGSRLFHAGDDVATFGNVLQGALHGPRDLSPTTPESVDAIVMRSLSPDASARFDTAAAMADALEAAMNVAPRARVAEWMEARWPNGAALKARIAEIERTGEASAIAPGARSTEATESAVVVASAPSAVVAKEPERPASGPRLWAIPIVALAMSAAFFLLTRGREAPTRAPTELAAPSSERSSPLAAPSSGTPPEASVEVPSAAPLASSASRIESAPAPAAPSLRAPAKGPRKRGVCDPPYTLDAQGNHIWKRECFKP
ncbi:MAG: protein kinase [Myxococcales bacterium]|nr:protein kinase [Myxococcales bacterium]